MVNPTEHRADTPSAKTRFGAMLGGLLRGRGSGAPAGRRRVARAFPLLLVAVFASLLSGALTASPADAAPLRVASFFGKTGTGDGEFSATTGVGGLAVNLNGAGGVEAGSVYAVDRGGNRVERFAPNAITGAYEYKAQFGSKGTLGGQFETPQSVAVDQSTGAVYVLDGANLRVQKFSAGGSFEWAVGQNVLTGGPATGTVLCTVAAECKKGTTGALGGTFASTFTGQVAVDPTNHNVYVTDPGNRRVQQVSPTGTFLRAFGFDVDSANPSTGFEICTNTESCKQGLAVTAANPGVGGFAANQPTRLAVDASGDIYTVENTVTFRVQKFFPSGGGPGLTPEVFAPSILSGTSTTTTPTDVAINSTSGNVAIVKAFPAGATSPCPSGANSGAERRILELSTVGSLLETGVTCTWTTAGGTADINVVNSLATGTSGTLFVSSTTGEQRVYVVDATGSTPPPAIAMEPATVPILPTGAREATLNAEVTQLCAAPLATAYHFEYRKSETGAPWDNLPAVDTSVASIGPVSQTATGLEANRAYVARAIVNCQFNSASSTSTEEGFTTNALPVEGVATIPASPIGDTFAYLRGTLNPNNTDADYHFEYVSDAVYQADQPDGFDQAQSTPSRSVIGGVSQSVFAKVEGLSPGTAYHVRLVATNPLTSPAATDSGQRFSTFPAGASSLPARYFELVSATDTNGISPQPGEAAADGNSYVYDTIISSPGAMNGNYAFFRSSRSATGGWSQQFIGAPAPAPGNLVGGTLNPLFSGSDLSVTAFSDLKPHNPDDQNGEQVSDVYLVKAGSPELTWISRNAVIAPGVPQTESQPATPGAVYLSPDGQQIVFGSKRRLLPEDAGAANKSSLYEWTGRATNGRQALAVSGASGAYTLAVASATGVGTLTTGSPVVAGVTTTSSFGHFQTGDAVSGAGIPAGALITEIGPASLTLSANATLTGTQTVSAVETTPEIAVGATALEVQHYLEGLPSVGPGNVSVLGGPGDPEGAHPYGIEFTGALAGTYRPTIIAATSTTNPLVGGSPLSGAVVSATDPGGHLRLVSRVPPSPSAASCDDGAQSTLPRCTYATTESILGSNGEAATGLDFNAVSPDGSRVVFESGASASAEQLYVRLDGERTVEASASAPGVSPPITAPFNVNYSGADAADATVFFTSSSPLTPDSHAPNLRTGAADLYAYEPPNSGDPSDGHLTDVTPIAAGGAGVSRAYAVSQDGRRIYFTATQQLVPGKGTVGSENLYLAERSGGSGSPFSLSFIATVNDPEGFGGSQNKVEASREVAANAAGSVLAFRSTTSLVPGLQTGGTPQVFVYDRGREELSCASCPVDGSVPSSEANLTPTDLTLHTGGTLAPGPYREKFGPFTPHTRNVSSEGAVFFQTSTGLLPADTNGTFDVYEYRGGSLGLISPGQPGAPSVFGDASSDGASVFIRSGSSLGNGAQAGIGHIYAARTGVAPVLASMSPPCSSSEACQGSVQPGPTVSSEGSSTFSEPPSPLPKRKKHPKHRRVHRHHTKKHHGKSQKHRKHKRERHGRRSKQVPTSKEVTR